MPLSFMRDEVTVIRPATKEARGSTVQDWDDATEHSVTRCQVTASQTSQNRDGRVVQVTDRRTFRAAYDADIQAGDRVVYGDATYEVDGEVFRTKSPTGRVSSTRCSLVLWKG